MHKISAKDKILCISRSNGVAASSWAIVRPNNMADEQQESIEAKRHAAGSGQKARDLMRRRCLAIGEPKAKTELSTAATAHQSESVSLSFCSDLSRKQHGLEAEMP